MLIGLSALKTVQKAPVLDAWFQSEENVPDGDAAVQSVKSLIAGVQIKNSLRNIGTVTTSTTVASSVPSLPRFAETPPAPVSQPAKSPYQSLSDVLDSDSRSSQWLQAAGLLQKFMTIDCFVDMTMTSEGGVSSVLRSPDGFRRTVMCRPDGSISQRITGPNGDEVVRFTANGDAVVPADKQTIS
jgi:hypothetical protein